MEKRSEDDRPISALSSAMRPGSEASADRLLSGRSDSETHDGRECTHELMRRVWGGGAPTELVVLQHERSLAHHGGHRDLPGGELAEVLLVLLPLLGVQRCFSAGGGDHLAGEPHRSNLDTHITFISAKSSHH